MISKTQLWKNYRTLCSLIFLLMPVFIQSAEKSYEEPADYKETLEHVPRYDTASIPQVLGGFLESTRKNRNPFFIATLDGNKKLNDLNSHQKKKQTEQAKKNSVDRENSIEN